MTSIRTTALITDGGDDATQNSLIEDADDAAAASQAILDVVQAVRAGTPLGST
jgi:hypothetical protein